MHTGKWLIVAEVSEIDATWALVREAVLDGQLGPCAHAKVATMRPNEFAPNPNIKASQLQLLPTRMTVTVQVICAYTSDVADERNLVREALRAWGFTSRMAWKSDADTIAGNYSHRGEKPKLLFA